MQLGLQEFNQFAQFLQDACGIYLGPNKQYLVTTRISRILEDHNISSLSALLDCLDHPSYVALRNQIIDAMTTNETYWFRDSYPFDYLKNTLLPEKHTQKTPATPTRIWSAACSSGQEPYSISMTVEEYRQANPLKLALPVEIVATDISESVLESAASAAYGKLSITRGLSRERFEQFFEPQTESTWQVKPNIRECIRFKKLNLQESFDALGKFDIIFCRNVLIYFSAELKQDILTRFHSALKPQGLLCLGSSEGLSNVANLFDMVQCKPGIMYKAK